MNTEAIRQQLHNYLEIAGDKKLKAIYTMVEDEIIESSSNYSEAFKVELDNRYNNYKSGNTKAVSASESKKRINKILKNKKAGGL